MCCPTVYTSCSTRPPTVSRSHDLHFDFLDASMRYFQTALRLPHSQTQTTPKCLWRSLYLWENGSRLNCALESWSADATLWFCGIHTPAAGLSFSREFLKHWGTNRMPIRLGLTDSEIVPSLIWCKQKIRRQKLKAEFWKMDYSPHPQITSIVDTTSNLTKMISCTAKWSLAYYCIVVYSLLVTLSLELSLTGWVKRCWKCASGKNTVTQKQHVPEENHKLSWPICLPSKERTRTQWPPEESFQQNTEEARMERDHLRFTIVWAVVLKISLFLRKINQVFIFLPF